MVARKHPPSPRPLPGAAAQRAKLHHVHTPMSFERPDVDILADEDLLRLLAKAKDRKHVIVHGRVPFADEPVYVGMG